MNVKTLLRINIALFRNNLIEISGILQFIGIMFRFVGNKVFRSLNQWLQVVVFL